VIKLANTQTKSSTSRILRKLEQVDYKRLTHAVMAVP
jgi:hypothetical protein